MKDTKHSWNDMIFLQNIVSHSHDTSNHGKKLSYNFIEYKIPNKHLLSFSLNEVFQNCSKGGMYSIYPI